MYEKPFTVEIVTPVRMVFSGQATSLSAPGVEGGFQVLASHAPFISAIGTGPVTVKGLDGTDTVYATSGGFVEVRNNKVTVVPGSGWSPTSWIPILTAHEPRWSVP
jgi:F-type H+-transporting ATPase subunit epsilon